MSVYGEARNKRDSKRRYALAAGIAPFVLGR